MNQNPLRPDNYLDELTKIETLLVYDPITGYYYYCNNRITVDLLSFTNRVCKLRMYWPNGYNQIISKLSLSGLGTNLMYLYKHHKLI